jgi:hypothetical protein
MYVGWNFMGMKEKPTKLTIGQSEQSINQVVKKFFWTSWIARGNLSV